MARKSKRQRRARRAAIVMAAAQRLGCTIEEFFRRATKHAKKALANLDINLNNIPRYVFKYALVVLGKIQVHLAPTESHLRYWRTTPALMVH